MHEFMHLYNKNVYLVILFKEKTEKCRKFMYIYPQKGLTNSELLSIIVPMFPLQYTGYINM